MQILPRKVLMDNKDSQRDDTAESRLRTQPFRVTFGLNDDLKGFQRGH
jgi:hypothetical protein